MAARGTVFDNARIMAPKRVRRIVICVFFPIPSTLGAALAATHNTVRTAALGVLVLFTGSRLIEYGLIHQQLIAEHVAMNVVSGWSFWPLTAGCYTFGGALMRYLRWGVGKYSLRR